MDIGCWLAITRGEFSAGNLPKRTAWMACHFSLSGAGLSNLPPQLPPGSLILVDDSTPPAGHDPLYVAAQLNKLVREQEIGGVILDFQRPACPRTEAMATYLVNTLPCPVCVSLPYGQALSCPVLLPLPPLNEPPEKYFAPWNGRELWVEAATEAVEITVSQTGAVTQAIDLPREKLPFPENSLFCRYGVDVKKDRAVFTLARDREMLEALLREVSRYGVTRAVGLYSQLQNT